MARAGHGYSLTERLARAAIENGAGFEARFLGAEAAHFQHRPDQAEQELAALAAQATSDAEKSRVALLRFDNIYLERAADFQMIDDALDAITDPYWRDELANRRLFVTAIASGPREIVKMATTWSHLPDPALRVAVVHGLVRIGRTDEVIEQLTPRPGARAVPSPDEPWHQWMLFGHSAAALIYTGRLGEADELLTMAHRDVIDHPSAEARAFIADWLAVLRLEQGRPLSAFRRASQAYTLYQQLGRPILAQRSYVSAVLAQAMTGRAEEAAETLKELDALGAPIPRSFGTDLLIARAWAAAAAGDLPAARAGLQDATDLGQEVGHLVGAASALHGLARLGQARRVAARLNDLAAQVNGHFVVARAAYADAVAAKDAEALQVVSEGFEKLGGNLYAAEARVEAATVLRRSGRPRQAAAEEHRAGQLLSRCQGATTPVVRTIGAQARLTPGELDAAMQAAAGRSNKQIAADSHVSVRTVESHLQRVYEKLGISSRRELAAALRDQPAV